MRHLKKLAVTAIIIALLTALALPVSVTANTESDSISVVIRPDMEATNISASDRFVIYQIINGTVSGIDEPGEMAGASWGGGIDAAAFTEKVTEDTRFADAIAYVTLTAYGSIENAGDMSGLLAGCLHEYSYIAEAMAAVASECLTEPYTATTWDTGRQAWRFDVLSPGFYLIEDTFTEPAEGDKDDRAVPAIIEVTGDRELDLIVFVPEATRTVNYAKGSVIEAGTPFTYDVTCSLPYDIADYDVFALTVEEHIPDGIITDTGSITVTLDGQTITPGDDTYAVDAVSGNDGSTDMAIRFPDVKSMSLVQPESGSVIHISYNAVFGPSACAGVEMDSYTQLSYSLASDGSGEGVSVRQHAYMYTMILDIVTAPGSKYTLQNIEGLYATLVQEDGGQWRITQWHENQKDATVLQQPQEGPLHIIGIGDSAYYIHEVEAPDALAPFVDIPVNVTVRMDEDGHVTGISGTVQGREKAESDRFGSVSAGEDMVTLEIAHDTLAHAEEEAEALAAEEKAEDKESEAITSSGSGTVVAIALIVAVALAAIIFKFVTKKISF